MMITDKRRKQKAEAQRRYKLSEKGKKTQAKYYASRTKLETNRRWRKKNYHKILAQRAVHAAIRLGKLARQACEVCKKPNAFAHHDNYDKPLDVRWLCNFHHSEHHRNSR